MIIDFGLEPSVIDLCGAYLGEARLSPFDGVVFRAPLNNGLFSSSSIFTTTSLLLSDLSNSSAAVNRTNSIGWGKLKYNLALIQIPSSVPWGAGNYLAQLSNFLMLLQWCKKNKVFGIMFDVEPYDGKVWTYDNQALKTTYTFAQMQALVYNFGYNLGRSWQQEYSEIAIMTTSGYENAVNRGAPFEANEWGLYINFLDGLYDGAGSILGSAFYNKLILTTEQGYAETDEFNMLHYGYYQLSNNPLNLPGTRTGYGGSSSYFGKIDQYGMAIWLTKSPFDPATPDSNYWTPDRAGSMINYLQTLSTFCWVYSDTHYFMGPPFVGDSYVTKLNAARIKRSLIVGDPTTLYS